ncbi:hypothetical protein F4779DRAFT_576551, partial [Xylariaceae sp. FL0662B]
MYRALSKAFRRRLVRCPLLVSVVFDAILLQTSHYLCKPHGRFFPCLSIQSLSPISRALSLLIHLIARFFLSNLFGYPPSEGRGSASILDCFPPPP